MRSNYKYVNTCGCGNGTSLRGRFDTLYCASCFQEISEETVLVKTTTTTQTKKGQS